MSFAKDNPAVEPKKTGGQRRIEEATQIIQRLKVAISAKDELSACKSLQNICNLLELGYAVYNYQRAFNKAELCATLKEAMDSLVSHCEACIATLRVVNLMCRYGEANDCVVFSVIKKFGAGGICESTAAILKLYGDSDPVILERGCDAVRNLCVMHGNREKFSEVEGLHEYICKCIKKYTSDAHYTSWLMRVVASLCLKCDKNASQFVNAGISELLINVAQKHSNNEFTAPEICFAIRHIIESNENYKGKFVASSLPELLVSVIKNNIANEPAVAEAFRLLICFYSEESSAVFNRICNAGSSTLSSSGIVQVAIKSFKKQPTSDYIAKYGLHLLFLISLTEVLRVKMVQGTDILESLSFILQTVGSNALVAEWSSKIIYNLCSVPNATGKMKTVGLCEFVVATMQRHALNARVLEFACYAIGAMAKDKLNLERLAESGACEAVVGAIRRHVDNVNVVYRSTYAIHFLCQNSNNITWLGTTGACEVVTEALVMHFAGSLQVAQMTVRAIGSLSYKDEGNMERFRLAKVHKTLVQCMNTHMSNVELQEFACRAIYHLGLNNAIVTDFGSAGACAAVITVLETHKDSELVVSQACLAVHALAIKRKQEKVQASNTKKLIEGGVMELVVELMNRYDTSVTVQRAGGLAVTSLSKMSQYRERLGKAGVCELITNSFAIHFENELVFSSLCAAIDNMATDNKVNLSKFTELNFVDKIYQGLIVHERSEAAVVAGIRAIMTLASDPSNLAMITTEPFAKLILRLMKGHEKSADVARWCCQMLALLSKADEMRSLFFNSRGADFLLNTIKRHIDSAPTVMQACKCIIELVKLPYILLNQFSSSEACSIISAPLEVHLSNAPAIECICECVVALCSHGPNISKFSSSCAPSGIVKALKYHYKMSSAVKLLAECVYFLSIDSPTRATLGSLGACEAVCTAFDQHMDNMMVAQNLTRAFTGLAANNEDNKTKFGRADGCRIIATCLHKYSGNVQFAEWICGAVAALSDRHAANLESFGLYGTAAGLVSILRHHKHVEAIAKFASKACRFLVDNDNNCEQLAVAGIVLVAFQALEMHTLNHEVVENCGFLLGTISAVPSAVTPVVVKEHEPVSVERDRSMSVARRNSTASMKSSLESEHGDECYGNFVPLDFYSNPSSWTLLDACLKLHAKKESTASCLCFAIGNFAEQTSMSNPGCCDRLKFIYEQYFENGIHTQRILFAIGCVAASHKDNQLRFYKDGLIDFVCTAVVSHQTSLLGAPFAHGILRAVAGLCKQNVQAQNKLYYEHKRAVRSLMRFVVTSIKDPLVAKWGSEAITALAFDHSGNKSVLSRCGEWMGDALSSHMGNRKVVSSILEAMYTLTHSHVANRSVFGSSGTCHIVCDALELFLTDDWEPEVQRCCRVIANISANHGNNQQKFGGCGAGELLVRVLDQYCLRRSENDIERNKAIDTAKWCLWAIGNILVLGSGADMVLDGEEDDAPEEPVTLSNGMKKSTSTGGSLPLSELVKMPSSPEPSTGSSLSGFKRRSRESQEAPANLGPGFSFSAVSLVSLTSSTSSVEAPAPKYFNRQTLEEFGISSKIVTLITMYSDSGVILQWASRVINSLSKMRALRIRFRELNAVSAMELSLERVLAPFNPNPETPIDLNEASHWKLPPQFKDVVAWVKNAKESLKVNLPQNKRVAAVAVASKSAAGILSPGAGARKTWMKNVSAVVTPMKKEKSAKMDQNKQTKPPTADREVAKSVPEPEPLLELN